MKTKQERKKEYKWIVDKILDEGKAHLRITYRDATAEVTYRVKRKISNRYDIEAIRNDGKTNLHESLTRGEFGDVLARFNDIIVIGEENHQILMEFKGDIKEDAVEQEKEEKVNSELETKQSNEIEETKRAILNSSEFTSKTKETAKGRIKKGCEDCNYTGWKIDELTGLRMKCSCQMRAESNPVIEVDRTPKVKIENQDKLRLIIPESRLNDDYNSEIGREKIIAIGRYQDCKVINYTQYDETLNRILGEIAVSSLNNSYLIGAPNGFGKTTFVYTGIKRLLAQGKKAVPYLPLIELAEKKVEYEDRLLKKLADPRSNVKLRVSEDEFIWKDFVEADVLFTFLSSVESKKIESATLSALMTLRASKGKPTIVMMSTSLEVYTMENKLKEYYWADMLSYTDDPNRIGVDRLIHKSCYKRYQSRVQAMKGVDF